MRTDSLIIYKGQDMIVIQKLLLKFHVLIGMFSFCQIRNVIDKFPLVFPQSASFEEL